MQWFHDLGIKTKLLGGFILVAVIAGAIGAVGVTQIKKIDSEDTKMCTNFVAPMPDLSAITEMYLRARCDLAEALGTEDAAKLQECTGKVTQRLKEEDEAGARYGARIVSDEMRKAYAETQRKIDEYGLFAQDVLKMISEGQHAEASALLSTKGSDMNTAILEGLEGMAKMNAEGGKALSDANTQVANKATTLMFILLGFGVFLAVTLGLFMATTIARPLSRGVEFVQELRRGHLGMRLKMERKDEVGVLAQNMDAFADDLQNVVVGTMKKIAVGDLSSEVQAKDGQDEIAPALKQMIEALRNMTAEAGNLARAAVEGKLATRADASKYPGDYRKIVQGVNDTLDAVVLPINEAADVLEQVANRDLSARVKGDYKGDLARIKQSLNQAVDNLDQGMFQVAMAVEQVTSAASQIGSGSQSLAQGASEQASSLEEASSSLQEMSSHTKGNAGNAKEARGLAEGARAGANKGLESMSRLSDAMEKIKASSDATARIVKTIDEIAFQTNLLALNAAVEAARAGDAGKGFAVVAEEVRNLAMRSAEAAKNTANMIEESVHNAETGVSLNGEVLSKLQEITTQANKVGEVMTEIAAASEQQSVGINQVATAVEQMNQVTQQQAANSEESAAMAQELSGQAEELRTMVNRFRLSESIAKTGTGRAHRTYFGPPAQQAMAQTAKQRTPSLRVVPGGATGSHSDPEMVIPFSDEGDGAILKQF